MKANKKHGLRALEVRCIYLEDSNVEALSYGSHNTEEDSPFFFLLLQSVRRAWRGLKNIWLTIRATILILSIVDASAV